MVNGELNSEKDTERNEKETVETTTRMTRAAFYKDIANCFAAIDKRKEENGYPWEFTK